MTAPRRGVSIARSARTPARLAALAKYKAHGTTTVIAPRPVVPVVIASSWWTEALSYAEFSARVSQETPRMNTSRSYQPKEAE
jgi:hypothetical protein